MSFSKTKREVIKHYILEQVDAGCKDVVKKTVNAFEMTPTSVYRYIKEMETDGILTKKGHKYSLTEINNSFLYRTGEVQDEMEILKRDLEPLFAECSENVQRIWRYGLSEMINNVLDHSESQGFAILVRKTYMSTSVIIADNGVGIFRKIKEYYTMPSLEDAISELFKGKLTTDKLNHSGEGIFFTSNAMDVFAAISDGRIFTRNKFEEVSVDVQIPSLDSDNTSKKKGEGTIILLKLSNFSKKTIAKVMDRFSNDENGFYKTIIPIKNLFDDYPVSRSQAKRLVRRCESFREVVLDFEGVDDAGQGFMHELFVVFGNSHPDIKLVPLHTNSKVQRMIQHVTNTV